MKVDVHVGLALLVMRELCKQQGDCVECPLLSFCRSTNGFVPCMTDPDTFPNAIVKVEVPVDKGDFFCYYNYAPLIECVHRAYPGALEASSLPDGVE